MSSCDHKIFMTDFQCNKCKITLSNTVFGQTETFPMSKKTRRPFFPLWHDVKNDSGPFKMRMDFLCRVSPEEPVNGVSRADTFSPFRRRRGRWVTPIRKKKLLECWITAQPKIWNNIHCLNQQLRTMAVKRKYPQLFLGKNPEHTFCFCLYFLVRARDGLCLQRRHLWTWAGKKKTWKKNHQLRRNTVGAK